METPLSAGRDGDARHGAELVGEHGRLGEQVAHLGEEGLGPCLGVVGGGLGHMMAAIVAGILAGAVVAAVVVDGIVGVVVDVGRAVGVGGGGRLGPGERPRGSLDRNCCAPHWRPCRRSGSWPGRLLCLLRASVAHAGGGRGRWIQMRGWRGRWMQWQGWNQLMGLGSLGRSDRRPFPGGFRGRPTGSLHPMGDLAKGRYDRRRRPFGPGRRPGIYTDQFSIIFPWCAVMTATLLSQGLSTTVHDLHINGLVQVGRVVVVVAASTTEHDLGRHGGAVLGDVVVAVDQLLAMMRNGLLFREREKGP